jgi:hypothetical protein
MWTLLLLAIGPIYTVEMYIRNIPTKELCEEFIVETRKQQKTTNYTLVCTKDQTP